MPSIPNDDDFEIPDLIEKLPDDAPTATLNGNGHAARRRLTDDPATFRLSPDDSARLFGRRSQTQFANYAPSARPRDASGQVQSRKMIYDYPLPDGATIRNTYAKAIERANAVDPMRAALLSDMLSRIEAASHRYQQVRREEEEKFQNYNEESQRADRWIDQQIAQIKIDRDDLADKYDRTLDELTALRAKAREDASYARTAAGYDINFSGLDDRDEPRGIPAATAAEPIGAIRATERTSRPKPATMLQRLMAPPKVDATEASTRQVAVEPSVSRHGDFLPTHVPFPISEGFERAKTVEAIAVEQGLPIDSPAARQMTRLSRFMSTWCLIACGFIFGLSLGLLIGVIDPQMFSIRPSKVILPGLGFGLLGISMFWAIGRVISMVSALASEERHSSMLAMHRMTPDSVGRWLRWSAASSLFLLLTATLVLVSIEATVERHGILAAFIDSANNAAIAAGEGHITRHGPGGFAILCLVLTVSLPFVLFHAAEGWIEARSRCIRAYLIARRSYDAHEIASRLHEDRLGELREASGKAEESRIAAKNRLDDTTDVHALVSAALDQRIAALKTDSQLTDDNQTNEIQLLQGAEIAPPPVVVRDVDVALAVERSRESNARVREARVRRQEALSYYDRRIAALEQQRRAERQEIEPSSHKRVEDAYHDFIGAVLTFDGVYRREMAHVEQLVRPGVLHRFRDFFVKSPQTGR